MNIHLTNVDVKSFSGPNQFGMKLATALERKGHLIDMNPAAIPHVDLNLVFIEAPDPVELELCEAPIIHRLDGIWFKPEDFASKNAKIFATYEAADGIIFQSNFDKNMVQKHFGKRDVPTRVIRNGTYVQTFDTSKFNLEWLNNIREDFEKVFVASSQWTGRPHKRLDDNIRFVHEYSRYTKQRCCLITMGQSDRFKTMSETEYSKKFIQIHLGNVSPAQTYVPLCYADWFIHLAYLDHCPNVVVDALACQVPVICSSAGGTAELVKDRGVVIREKKFDYELCDYTKPPTLEFTEEHFECVNQEFTISKDDVKDLSMEYVVDEYLSFINEVCKATNE